MTNYKEILRLHSLGINNTRIAESCGCARSTVIAALQRAREQDLSWSKIKNYSTEEVAREIVSFHCAGPTIQDARLRVGAPRDAEERRHPEPSVGGILRAVSSKRRAALQIHPVQQVLCGLYPQNQSYHASGTQAW